MRLSASVHAHRETQFTGPNTIHAVRHLFHLEDGRIAGPNRKNIAIRPAEFVLNAVFFNLVTLRSGWEWELPVHARAFEWEELLGGYNNARHSVFGGFARALDWLAEGRIELGGLLRRVPPTDPASLYAEIAARRNEEPFIVLDWTDFDGPDLKSS